MSSDNEHVKWVEINYQYICWIVGEIPSNKCTNKWFTGTHDPMLGVRQVSFISKQSGTKVTLLSYPWTFSYGISSGHLGWCPAHCWNQSISKQWTGESVHRSGSRKFSLHFWSYGSPHVIPTFVILASSQLSWWKEAAITDTFNQQWPELS